MIVSDRTKRAVALGFIAVWVSLFCIHVTDTVHDCKKRTGPEADDQQVEQALITPAEPDSHLLNELFPSPASPHWVNIPLDVLLPQAVPVASYPATFASAFKALPPQFKPKLFQLFSIYRL